MDECSREYLGMADGLAGRERKGVRVWVFKSEEVKFWVKMRRGCPKNILGCYIIL